MKKRLALVMGVLLLCSLMLFAACGKKKKDPPKETTASYTVEYYLENDSGEYVLSQGHTETLSDTVGNTVRVASPKTIDGYVFESENGKNVTRGTVLADGSLKLKLYYCQDYAGRVTFETDWDEELDVLVGSDTPFAVTVKVDGAPKTEGLTYTATGRAISVEDGVIKATRHGESDVTIGYKNVLRSFHVTAYDKFIATEQDWWDMYEESSNWYKLTADVTLSEDAIYHFRDETADPSNKPLYEGYGINKSLDGGLIDGGGHSLAYTSNRLFHYVSNGAVIRNITLNATDGFYWGAAIAYGCSGSTVENVTLNASWKFPTCSQFAGIWITLGGDAADGGNANGNGGMFGLMEPNCTIKDCTLNLDISQIQSQTRFGAIAFKAEGCTISGNTIVATDGEMPLLRYDHGDTCILENNTVRAIGTASYTVEYYLEGTEGAGDFVKDESKTETVSGSVGEEVTLSPKAIAGYAFDSSNANNVLGGTISDESPLVLKLYYKKSAVTFETETADAFELEKTETKNLAVTVKDGDVSVTEGVTYTSRTPAVATVENGVVTAVAGGTAVIAVEYKGASKEFTVTVWDLVIENETDWWAMFAGATSEATVHTIAGRYKLAQNITLTKSSVEYYGTVVADHGHEQNPVFAGYLDGNNKTIAFTGADGSGYGTSNRLFYQVTGTIENLTYNAGKGFYWGGAIAYYVNDATFRNVTVTATFDRDSTSVVNPALGWITNTVGTGVFGVYLNNATIENCTANVSLTKDATAVFVKGIGYDLVNCTVKNVKVNADAYIQLYGKVTGGTVDDQTTLTVNHTPSEEVVEIATEDDWWNMYRKNGEHIYGNYKLTADITLTKNVCMPEAFGKNSGDECSIYDPHKYNVIFHGTLDGDNHTITYAGTNGSGAGNNRLFYEMNGTMKNLTYNAGTGFYWGSVIAFTVRNGKMENVTVNATIDQATVNQFVANMTLTPNKAGVLYIYGVSAELTNVAVNVELTGAATSAYYVGIGSVCGEGGNNDTFTNVVVRSHTELTLYEGNVTADADTKFQKLEGEVTPSVTEIASEDDWWNMYKAGLTVSGNYKLTADITLTKNSCMPEAFGQADAHTYNVIFTGTLDGNGHTITYVGADGEGTGNNRLFYEMNGTMKNLTYNAGKGFYWGSAIALPFAVQWKTLP